MKNKEMNKKITNETKRAYQERKINQVRTAMNRTDIFPTITVSFQMTTECNFRCTYCYEKKKKGSLHLDAAKTLLYNLIHKDKHKDYWKDYLPRSGDFPLVSKIMFDFFGGECLLEIDKISILCDFFKEECEKVNNDYTKSLINNLEIILQTNGYLLRTKKVREFIGKWAKNIHLCTSLDGNKEYHDKCRVLKDSGLGTFDIVKKNIIDTLEEFPTLGRHTSRSTISSDSLPYLYDAYLELESLGWGAVSMPLALGAEWKEGDDLLLKEQLTKIIDHMIASDHIPIFSELSGANDDINGMDLYGNSEKNSNRIDFLKTGICYLAGNGIAIDVNDKLYTCIQLSELTIPEELGRKDLSIGTAKDGITDEGMKIVRELRHAHDKYAYEHKECGMCPAKMNCEYCPAMSYKATGDISLRETPECKLRKVLVSMGLVYRLKLEHKKWKRASENLI